jgi:hypothetical protein
MILMILISIFAVLLLWMLLGPVIIYVDTERTVYRLNLPGIFLARAVPEGPFFHIRGRILFIPYRFDPFRSGEKKSREKKKKTTRKKKPFSFSGLWDLVRGFLSAFRIRRLKLDIDTEDPMLNAWLIPVFTAVNSDRIRLTANFEGNASLVMDVRTRLGSLAWIFIRKQYQTMLNH